MKKQTNYSEQLKKDIASDTSSMLKIKDFNNEWEAREYFGEKPFNKFYETKRTKREM